MPDHLARARKLIELQRCDLAVDALRAALCEDPQDAEMHSLLGYCLASLGRLDEAMREATLAVELAPNAAPAHFVLALVLACSDKCAQSFRAINEAIRLNPDDADYYGFRAALHVGRMAWKNVEFSCKRGLEVNPRNAHCVNYLSLSLYFQNRPTEARRHLDLAKQLEPDSYITQSNIGWQAAFDGDYKLAEAAFRESLRTNPNWLPARQGLRAAQRGQNIIYRPLLRWILWEVSKRTPRRLRQFAFAVFMVVYMGAFFAQSEIIFPIAFSVRFLFAVSLPFVLFWCMELSVYFYRRVFARGRDSASESLGATLTAVWRLLAIPVFIWLSYRSFTESSAAYGLGAFTLVPLSFLFGILRDSPSGAPRALTAFTLVAMVLLSVLATFESLSSPFVRFLFGVLWFLTISPAVTFAAECCKQTQFKIERLPPRFESV